MQFISQYRQYFKYLFVPGLILTVAGLVAGLTTQTWSPLYVILLITGGIILLIWLIFIVGLEAGFWRRRSTQVGTNAIVSTLAILVILGLINFLSVRYAPRIDLTENQLFTLSPQSQGIVKNLQKPLKVWIFLRQSDSVDQELLETYRRYNPNFEFQFVDPDTKLGLVKQFNVKSLGDVYLEYGEKKQLVQTLIEFKQKQPISEIKLTNAIEKIQRDHTPTVYFLQGHGEHPLNSTEGGFSDAVNSLKDKGYKVEPLNLIERSKIPDDADVIVIAGSQKQLFEQEVKILTDYSNQGGSLFLMIDPDTDPDLKLLLKEWGVQLDPRVIIDPAGKDNNLGLGTPVIINYGEHPITKEFKNGFSLYPFARPIGTTKVKGLEAVALLVGTDKMWAESNLNIDPPRFDSTADLAGPFDLGVALTRKLSETNNQPKETLNPIPSPTASIQPKETLKPNPSPTASIKPKETLNYTPSPTASIKPKETLNYTPSPNNNIQENSQSKKTEAKMVVIGNSTFATDGWFKQQLNGDVFLNSVQWLANGDEQPLSISPKELKNRRIILTPIQASIIAWMSLIIMPLLGLVIAGFTWWRRR